MRWRRITGLTMTASWIKTARDIVIIKATKNMNSFFDTEEYKEFVRMCQGTKALLSQLKEDNKRNREAIEKITKNMQHVFPELTKLNRIAKKIENNKWSADDKGGSYDK